MRIFSMAVLVGVSAALLAMNAHAQLVSTDGGLGVYDTTNNVTWTSNANLMATQAASFSGGAAAFVSAMIADSGGVIHDTPGKLVDPTGTYTLSASDFNSSAGTMDWWGAQAWAHYLDVTNYGGSNQWALPTLPTQGLYSAGQLSELFYGGLGQAGGSSITTTHNSNYTLFSNMQSGTYWYGTEAVNGFCVGCIGAYFFDTSNGVSDFADLKTPDYYALAVSPGQVSAVPLPGAAWLLGSGLLGLMGFGRHRVSSKTV